jgi:phage tail tape-measure protein
MANERLNIDIVARDKSQQALGRLQGNLQRVKQSVFNLRNAFIGLGAGVVIKGFVDAGIQVENLSVQLKTLFGSAQAGEKALRSITKFAAGTPFELSNIQQGVTSLAVVRKKAEEAGLTFDDLLTITGNVAAQMGGYQCYKHN